MTFFIVKLSFEYNLHCLVFGFLFLSLLNLVSNTEGLFVELFWIKQDLFSMWMLNIAYNIGGHTHTNIV